MVMVITWPVLLARYIQTPGGTLCHGRLSCMCIKSNEYKLSPNTPEKSGHSKYSLTKDVIPNSLRGPQGFTPIIT